MRKESWNTKLKRIKREGEQHGHIVKEISDGMSDMVECSCGWKSEWYWDGAEYAISDWMKHIWKVNTVRSKRL